MWPEDGLIGLKKKEGMLCLNEGVWINHIQGLAHGIFCLFNFDLLQKFVVFFFKALQTFSVIALPVYFHENRKSIFVHAISFKCVHCLHCSSLNPFAVNFFSFFHTC